MAGTAFKNLALNTLVLTSSDYTALEALIAAKADQSDLTALESTVGQNTSAIGALQTRCTTIESAAEALEGRVETNEGAITALQTRCGTIESAAEELEERVETNEGDISGLKTRCGTIESAATALAARVTTAEGEIDDLQLAIGDCDEDDPAASKSYVDAQVSTIPKFNIEVVTALPTSNISYSTVYLLKTGDEEGNLYEEYIRVKGKDSAPDSWEKLGTQTVDLSNYYTKDEADAAIESAVSEVSTALTTHTGNSDIHVTAADKAAWSAKQNALSTAQLAACNSGVTAAKVAAYDEHVADTDIHVTAAQKTAWTNKLDKLGNVNEGTTVSELITKLGGTIVTA